MKIDFKSKIAYYTQIMNIYRLIFALIFCFCLIFWHVSPLQAATVADKYHGATLVPRNSTDPSSAQWKQSLRDLKANNVNLVTYVLLYRQSTIHSSEIYTSSNNPTDASLIEGIQYAHSLGLRVQLKPHVDNDDVPTYWRGEINPTDKAAWFRNYGEILKHTADIARASGVEEICVGTELYDLTLPGSDPANTAYWRNLISMVRANYSGVLTYSSVFTYELDHIGFWQDLDYIGISGYWQLSSGKNPSVAELLASWNSINTNLLQPLSQKYNKPIVLTEVGYRSMDCTTVYTWGGVYCGNGVNMNEQVNAFEAMLSFWENTPNLRGVIIWGFEADPQYGGINDNSFSPQNKPALQNIKKWFGGTGTILPPSSDPAAGVFDDNYQRDWTDWSWDMNVAVTDNPSSTGKVLKAITLKPWAGLRLNSFMGQETIGFDRISFSISTTASDQQYGMWLVDSNGGQASAAAPVSNYLVSSTDGWKNYSIPLKDLNSENKVIKDIIFQDWSGRANSITYFDQIAFQGNPAASPSPSPIPTPTPMPSPTPSISPSPTPSASPTPSPSANPTLPPGVAMSANPNPCYIAPNQTLCTSRISWSVANPQGTVEVRIKETGGLFGRAPSASNNAPWININPLHFDLYDGSHLLYSLAVVGSTKRGTITADPNPCQIPTGSNNCTETINWSVVDPQGVVQVRVREANGLFAQAPSGSQAAPWVREAPLHMDLYEGNTLLDTVVIAGKSVVDPSPTPSVSPSPSPSVQPLSGLLYDDALSSSWVNWSWDSLVDFASSIFYQGSKSISFKSSAAWAGLRLHSDTGIDTNSFNYLTFAVKANIADRPYGVLVLDKDGKQIGQSVLLTNYGGAPTVDAFKVYSIPLSDFGPKGIVKDIIIQDWSGKNDGELNIDEAKFKTN